MSFETASALVPAGHLRWTGLLTGDWAQGRTTFGGLLAAMAGRAAVEVAGPERPLRTLDIAFVAPLPPGPVTVDVEVLGAGRAVTQLVVSLRQGDVLGTRVHVVAGASRESRIVVPGEPGPDADPEAQGEEAPYVPGVMPAFMQHLAMRWTVASLPYSGAGPEGALITGWCRHRTPATGLPALLALVDAWPPSVLSMATGPTPASTVRWAVHLLEPVAPDDDPGWLHYDVRTEHSAQGYATSHARVHRDGRLVAWSEQLVAVFDSPPAAAPVPV